jgi:hypothetical protein
MLQEDFYEGFQYCPQHTKQYDDLIQENPELAVSLADILPDAGAEWQDAQQPEDSRSSDREISPYHRSDQILRNQYSQVRLDAASSRSTIARSSSLSSASSSRAPSSAPRKHYQYQHHCLECGAAFDRASRARDHQYKDLGQTPYACGGRCGKGGW